MKTTPYQITFDPTFKSVDLKKIKELDRLKRLYKSAKETLPLEQQSLYGITTFIYKRLVRSILTKYFKAHGILDKEDQQAFMQTSLSKTVIREGIQATGLKDSAELINVVQHFMLKEWRIKWGDIQEESTTQEVEEPWSSRETKKPSVTLTKTIKEAQKRVEEAGGDPGDRYEIVRELEAIANTRYRGGNYFNQLKRMNITTTHDYLSYVEYFLERGR